MQNQVTTKNEFEKIRVLCDYLLFDQFSERVAFPRFLECIGILVESQNFNLKKIFMELSGKNKKYITFARLLNAYENRNSNESSTDLKNFFNYFIKTVIKDPSQIAGKDVPNAKQYSTISHKNREFINKIEIFTDDGNKIKGLGIEYDDLFDNQFICDDMKNKKLRKKVCLNLKNLQYYDEDNLDEDALRDYVTHIYGTYSTQIEFLGFNTSSGKMYYTGDPKKGTPFLFGKFHQKFHYLKLGMKDGGISYIKPFFVPSVFFNFNINIDYDIYKNDDFEFEGIEKYEDELLLESIVDEQMYLSQVLIPLYEDDLFYQYDEEDRFDKRLRERYTFEQHFTIDNKQTVSSKQFLSETMLGKCNDDEENGYFLEKYEEIILTEGGLGPDNNLDDYFNDDNDEDDLEKKELEEIEALEWEMEKLGKSNELHHYKLTYLNKWNGVSVKTLDVPNLFSDPFSLERFADRYFNEVQYEIDNRITRVNEYLNPDNFYSKFFLYDNCCMHKYEPELFDDDYTDELFELKDKFEQIAKKFLGKEENISTGKLSEISNTNTDIRRQITIKLIDQRTLVRKWISFAYHFKKKLTFSGIITGIAVETARKILVNCENNFVDRSFSLVDKIKVLDILSELKPKKNSNQPIKLLEIDYVKKGMQIHIRSIVEKRKEDKKKKVEERRRQEELKREQEIKRVEEKKREEQRKREEEERKKEEQRRRDTEERKRQSEIKKEADRIKEAERKRETDKKREEEIKLEQEKKRKEEKEREEIRKKEEEAKKQQEKENKFPAAKPIVEKQITIDDINLINRDLERIQTIIKEGKVRNESEKHSLIEQLDSLKKKKMEMTKYLLEINKQKISEQVDIDIEDLKFQEAEKRKKIIDQEIANALAEKENQEILNKKKLRKPVTFSEFDIPATTEIYRDQEIFKGKEFTDQLFPPTIQSLCPYDENHKSWILPQEIESEDLTNWERFSWARIDQIFRTPDYQMFVNKIEPADIIQGSLGDCYFLSAIAALCKFPDLIKKLFLFKERSLDRCYGIYLRKNGIWKLVLLDDYVPCYGGARKKFAFSSANENEMWVVLLEKAWAKICGSYAKAIAGQSSEVFDAITNAPTEIIWIPQISKDALWNKLSEGKNNEFIMTAGTGSRISQEEYERVNLEPGHAYTVIDIVEVKVGTTTTKLLKIRNPWGIGEWSGNWSDKSNLWTPTLMKQVGLEDKDDGVFFMSFEDFLKYYIVVNICRIHKDYNYSFVKFKKTEVKKPNVLCLDLEKESKVYLQMHQKNPRYLLRNGENSKQILMHMMVVDENMNFLGAGCDDSSSIFLSLDLKPGTYYLYTDINHRYVNLDEIHGYNVTCYSSSVVSLENDTTMDPLEVSKKGIISYAKSKLKAQKRDELQYYIPNNIIPEFPYIFGVYDNIGTRPAEVTFELSYNKESSFFPDENLSIKKLTKKIEPKNTEVFYIIRHRLDSALQYNWNSKKI